MSGAIEVGAIGLCAAAACLAAYIYAFIFKPVGARWLQIVGLVATMVALVLLSLDLRVSEGGAALMNRLGAVGFLTVAAIAQAMQALRRRRGERCADRPEHVRVDEAVPAQG